MSFVREGSRVGATRWLSRWLLAVPLFCGAGCLSCLHPAKPSEQMLETCHSVPPLGRNHVYIFFVGNLDPLNCANLTGVRDCLQSLGFIKTYYGQAYHVCWFKNELCRLHEEDPAARFVLIGHGCGANVANALAWKVAEQDIHIDLLVYLDASRLDFRCERPGNVEKVVHISGTYCVSRRKNLNDVENIHLDNAGCLGAATHPQTLDLLTEELTHVACRVPINLPAEPSEMPNPETAPTPRPVVPQPTSSRDEWDFLKPVVTLHRQPPDLGFGKADAQAGNPKSHSVMKPQSDPPSE